MFCLLQAVDRNKDQTYFLARVSQEQFRNVIFPIGDLTKKEVKRIATEYGLGDIAKKKEVKICFCACVY